MFALHVSDTHLGATPSSLLFRARDVYEAFIETIDIALKERVNLYIHAGDFFNTSNPPPETYVVAYRGLKKIKERGVKVIAIAGQHDLPKRYSLSPLSILKDVGVIDYVAIDNVSVFDVDIGILRTRFICVPYNHRHKIPSLLIQKEVKPILVAHLLLKELGIPSSEADISLDLIPQGFKYVALGDYHIKTLLRGKDGVPVVYPGATEVHKVNEYGKKFVALVDLSSDEVNVNFVELTSVRPWVILECNDVKKCVSDVIDNSRSIIASGKKKPLAYLIVDKLRTEVVAKYLEELVTKNIIEHYYLAYGEEEEEGKTVSVEPYIEKLEYIDVEKIVKKLVGDEELASRILNLVENPSDRIAEDLVQYIKSNTERLKDLEQRIKYALNLLQQTSSISKPPTENTSSHSQSKNTLFKEKFL